MPIELTTHPQSIACPACDLLLHFPPIVPGSYIYCPRCHQGISHYKRNVLDRTLALTLTGIIFFSASMTLPFLQLMTAGKINAITLIEGIWQLADSNYHLLAFIISLLVLVIPIVMCLSVLLVVVPIKHGRITPWTVPLLRGLFAAKDWSMVEVFGIGVLISFIKIVTLGFLSYGIGFWCYLLFMVTLLALSYHLDRWQFWQLYLQIQHVKNR